MLKLNRLLKIALERGSWLCRNLSGLVMKIFVPVTPFFKTYTYVTCVKNCKLDEIAVKTSIYGAFPHFPLSPTEERVRVRG
jgi:hypothetical protein